MTHPVFVDSETPLNKLSLGDIFVSVTLSDLVLASADR